MKKLLILLPLFLSLLTQAQYVFISLRPSKTDLLTDPFWNNWIMKGQANDSSQRFTDIAGDTTRIRAVINDLGADFDNGLGYKPGQTFLPDAVIQKGIYHTAAIPVTLLVDTGYTYTVTFFSSRDIVYQKNQYTKITIGSQSVTILTDTNTTRPAVFANLSTTTGKLAFAVQPVTGAYLYLNAIAIVGIPKKPPVSVRLKVDSVVINTPNSIVHVTPSLSDGSAVAWQVEQKISDAKKALIFPASDSSFILAGLQPGIYNFVFRSALDKYGNFDTAAVAITVNPFKCPTCPPPVVCPVCPVIPPPRTATVIQVTINGLPFNVPLAGTKITYSDGQP